MHDLLGFLLEALVSSHSPKNINLGKLEIIGEKIITKIDINRRKDVILLGPGLN